MIHIGHKPRIQFPPLPTDRPPVLSIVIPVYNEAATIASLLSDVAAAPAAGLTKEIIIVNDCSTDGTGEVLEGELPHLRERWPETQFRLHHHPVNRGKGAALRTGFAHVTGEIVIVQDADREYDPNEYGRLLAPILAGKADACFGSRFLGGETHRVLYFYHYLGNRFLTLLSNLFTDLNLTDMETCYKMFRAEVLDHICLVEDRFGFEPEFTQKIARLNIRIYETGISYHGRSYEEGKKIGWKDGVRAIYCILKYALFDRGDGPRVRNGGAVNGLASQPTGRDR
jgi:glycosyltransferase involved in cell wall biosynthesis